MADGRSSIANAIFLLARQSPDAIIVQARTTILYANQHALRLFGYGSITEIRAIPVEQTIVPEDREDALRFNKARFDNPSLSVPSEYECKLLRKDRITITARVFVMMAETDTGPLALVTFYPHGQASTSVLRDFAIAASDNIVSAREAAITHATEPLAADTLVLKEIVNRLERRIEDAEHALSNGLKERMAQVETEIKHLYETFEDFTDDRRASKRGKISTTLTVIGLGLGLVYWLVGQWDKLVLLWKGHG